MGAGAPKIPPAGWLVVVVVPPNIVLVVPNPGVWKVGAAAPVGLAPKALPNPELLLAPKPPEDNIDVN